MKPPMNIKQIVKKGSMYFIAVLGVCTIISRSVYTYLLPVVSLQEVKASTVESQIVVDGNLGLDANLVKKQQLIVKAPIDGKVKVADLQEDMIVEEGYKLFQISEQKTKDAVENEALESLRLSEEYSQLERQSARLKEEMKRFQEEIEKKKTAMQGICEMAEVIKYEEDITSQTKQVETNKLLYQEELLSEEEYTSSMQQLERYKREKAELIESKTKEFTDAIQELQNNIASKDKEIESIRSQMIVKEKEIEVSGTEDKNKSVNCLKTGYLQEITVLDGIEVAKGDQLAIIVPKSIPYRVTCELTERQAETVKAGQEIEWVLNGTSRKAIVVQKNMDTENKTYTISCDIDEGLVKELELEPNYYKTVTVKIIAKAQQYDKVIPNSAIVKENGDYYIYTVNEDETMWGKKYIVSRQGVTILKEGDYTTAIEAGIEQGMKVIAQTSKALSNGTEVLVE